MPNIEALGLVVSDDKMFLCFPCISLCKTCDHQRMIENKLGRGPLVDASQGST